SDVCSSDLQPEVLALGINRHLEKFHVADAGNLHRILERQEQALAGAFLGVHLKQILALELHAAGSRLVARTTGEHVAEGTLAGAVAPHDGTPFARLALEIQTLEDVLLFHFRLQPFARQHLLRPIICMNRFDSVGNQPTEPSRLTSSSLPASTANSIGSSLNTSRQKPLTIMDTAFSASSPRCWQRNSWSSLTLDVV